MSPDPGHRDPPPAEHPRRGVSRVVGHAYTWDVIGDPLFVDRVQAHGIGEVALASTYHATRAATPQHPLHRLVEAPHAALYRPVRAATWARRALRPVSADWVASADPFAEATAALVRQGIVVDAWVILAHSTRLGGERPDLTVRNCFGDPYSYALCPAHDEVRDYAALLAAEAVRDVPVAGVSIESCGQLGMAHNGVHEKTVGAYPPAAERVLSVCCCEGCRRQWVAAGADVAEVTAGLRNALRLAQGDQRQAQAGMDFLLGKELVELLLSTRLSNQDAVRAQVLAALREVAPAARVTMHGQPDPWATGPSPAVTVNAAAEVDAILVPAWNDSEATREAIAAARRLAPVGVEVAAYATVLPPADPATVDAHSASLVAAGADELHLYHLGLANEPQLEVLGRIASTR